MPANLENSAVATGLAKVSFSFQSQNRAVPKNVQTTTDCELISHSSKIMLKFLQVRLQQYMNQELPDVRTGFSKVRGTRVHIANIQWIIEKAKEFQKNKQTNKHKTKHLLLFH